MSATPIMPCLPQRCARYGAQARLHRPATYQPLRSLVPRRRSCLRAQLLSHGARLQREGNLDESKVPLFKQAGD